MNWKEFLKPTKNKIILSICLFLIIILLGMLKITYKNIEVCSLDLRGACTNVREPAYGIPTFYYLQIAGDVAFRVFYWHNFILNIILIYIIAGLFSTKINLEFLSLSKKKIIQTLVMTFIFGLIYSILEFSRLSTPLQIIELLAETLFIGIAFLLIPSYFVTCLILFMEKKMKK